MRAQTGTPTTPAALRALALGLGLLATTACAGGDPTGPGPMPFAEARALLGGKGTGSTGDVTTQGGLAGRGVDAITTQGKNSKPGGGMGDVTAQGGSKPAGSTGDITAQGGGGIGGVVEAFGAGNLTGGGGAEVTPQGRLGGGGTDTPTGAESNALVGSKLGTTTDG
jgi:hypothetical protein